MNCSDALQVLVVMLVVGQIDFELPLEGSSVGLDYDKKSDDEILKLIRQLY